MTIKSQAMLNDCKVQLQRSTTKSQVPYQRITASTYAPVTQQFNRCATVTGKLFTLYINKTVSNWAFSTWQLKDIKTNRLKHKPINVLNKMKVVINRDSINNNWDDSWHKALISQPSCKKNQPSDMYGQTIKMSRQDTSSHLENYCHIELIKLSHQKWGTHIY